MRICLVVRGYWPEKLTMLPRIVYELAKRFSVTNVVTILSDQDNNHRGDYVISENITIRYVEDVKKEIDGEYNIVHFFGSLLGMCDLISNHKHRNKSLIFSLYTAKIQAEDFKFIRMTDFIKEKRTLRLINPLLSSMIPDYCIRSNLDNNSVIITQGKRYEQFYSKMLNGKGRVIRIPHGIDLDQFSSVQNEEATSFKISLGFSELDKIVLYFGHSYLTRGIDDVIYSMKRIQKIDKHFKLLLVLNSMPDSSSLDYITKLASDLGKDSYKIILRYVKRPELYYKISDCVVLPYRFVLEIPEYPFVLLEAMATGKPVITSPIGSLPELIQNNYNGILTDKNVDTLAEDILSIISNDELNKYLGNNAKKSIEEFDWKIVTKSVLDLYEEMNQGKITAR